MACPTPWKFAPQVSVIDQQPTPNTTPPVYSAVASVVLTYPFVSPTTTLTLRSPVWGDHRNVTVEATRQVSMGGVLTIARNPLWPIVDVFNYDFEAIDDPIVDSYFAFLAVSLGMEVGLRDHRNQQWRGFILNPDGAASDEQVCNNQVSIAFRGILT